MPLDESTWTPQGHLADDTAVSVALGRDADPDVVAHLRTCGTCRADVDAWTQLVTTARSGEQVDPLEPPSGTWETIARRAGLGAGDRRAHPAGPAEVVDRPTSRPVVVPLDLDSGRTAGRRRPGRRWWPVAAAAVIGLGLGVGGARVFSGPTAPSAPVVVSATTLEPLQPDAEAAGTAEVTERGGDRRLDVEVTGLQEPPGGFLEVWLLDADGGLVSVGAVSGGSASVVLPPDLDLGRFDVVDVSREPLDGDPGHSSDSLLRGVLGPSA